MFIEKDKDPIVQPHPFPHPITDQITTVEDGDFGFIAREKFTVNVDQHMGIAIIGQGVMGTVQIHDCS